MKARRKKGKAPQKPKVALAGGYFITFEGGEGAGKSTQIHQLAHNLQSEGYDVVLTREPGGTPGAEAIRHVLLHAGSRNDDPLMEAVLFAAARADHVDALIAPALNAGKIVLCDRYIDSTRVYQDMASKMPRGYIVLLEKIAVNTLVPDLTFILDLPAEEGIARAHARRKPADKVDRFERADISIQKNRRQAFLKIARMEPKRCQVVDAMRPIKAIAADIAQICHREIHKRDIRGL